MLSPLHLLFLVYHIFFFSLFFFTIFFYTDYRGDSMKCPRCGKEMSKDHVHTFCTHCGYLDDGKQIHGYQDTQASDLEIYLGKDFDKIWRNENWFTNFILGPFYLCYRGFVLLGLFFVLLECLFWVMMYGSFYHFRYLLLVVSIILSRTFFMACNNMICIYFYKRQIAKIKKKYPSTYLEHLRKNNGHINHYMSLFLGILLLILFVFTYILIMFYLWSK